MSLQVPDTSGTMGSIDDATISTANALPDLSHHINRKSKARHPSPLKDILHYMSLDGMISFAGGLPHPSLFAFGETSFTAYPPSTVVSSQKEHGAVEKDIYTVTKAPREGQSLCLVDALQYGMFNLVPSYAQVLIANRISEGAGNGDISIRKWAQDFTQQVFKPAYDEFEILLNAGNTDGWNKVVGLLCEEGDMILVEEATYPSAQALWAPLGCKAVPIKMDGEGMRADHLDSVLSKWVSANAGEKKPHLLYLVPAGSNPSGTLMGGARRQEIYNVCVKHDVVICEDDPYCFLQYAPYEIGQVFTPEASSKNSPREYAHSLAPSFLHFDYQGRVIRLETFSKTLAPGCRLGYFVANPVFTERLLRAIEVESQAPSGFSQAVVSNLLHKWGVDGYLNWVSNLRDQYRSRRDWMCHALSKHLSVRKSTEDLTAFEVSSSSDSKPIFSFVAPQAGMFLWAKFYLANSPRFHQIRTEGKVEDPEQIFSDELWTKLADALVLLTPGNYYTPWQGADKKSTKERGAAGGVGHLRMAFSVTSREDMEEGVRRMAGVLRGLWASE